MLLLAAAPPQVHLQLLIKDQQLAYQHANIQAHLLGHINKELVLVNKVHINKVSQVELEPLKHIQKGGPVQCQLEE